MNLLFGFSGRIGRLQWWLGQLAVIVVILLCVGIVAAVSATGQLATAESSEEFLNNAGTSVLAILFASIALMVWINLATTVKRFHDRNKSGFWCLIILIPYIGSLWQFVECGFLSGTPGGNDYGPSPGGPSSIADDFLAEGSDYARPSNFRPETAAVKKQVAAPDTARLRRPAPTGFGRRGV